MSKVEGRRVAVAEARKRYVDTGIEKDIAKAFRRYVKEEGLDFPAVITRESKYNLFPHSLRPECPECEKRMFLDLLNTNRRNRVGANEAGIAYKTCWVCVNEDCGHIGDWSVLTPKEWRYQLEKENL